MKKLQLFLFAISTLFFIACSEPNSPDKSLTITVAHVNDIHSHISQESLDLEINGVETRVNVGGYPRVLSEINSIESTQKNTLILNAGDAIEGTLYYTLFKGEADATMMNSIKWDAFVLGNHEFDDGDESLASFLNLLDVPIISANVVADKDDILYGKWKPYLIKNVDNEQIGIIGITIKLKTMESSKPSSKIKFYDEILTTQKTVDELKAKGVNKIILLSHYGYENDKYLASKIEGVDVIIGGDSHTLLGDFSAVGLTSEGNYPTEVLSKSSQKVCIVQAWSYTKVVGDLEVTFDEKGVVEKCEGTPTLIIGDTFLQKNEHGERVEVNSSIKEEIVDFINQHKNIKIVQRDENSLKLLESYKSEVDLKIKEIIGSATQTLRHIRVPKADYLGNDGSELPLGSEVAPIVCKAFYDSSLRSDAAILNAGGVRTNIQNGDITINTAYTLLPFSSTLYEIEMKGSEIKHLLEEALSNFKDDGGSNGSFPYAYGLKYDIDMRESFGNRVSNLEIIDRETSHFSSIDADGLYIIVTIDYLASGKDGYKSFKSVQDERGKGVNTYIDYALGFVNYVKAKTKNSQDIEKLEVSQHCIKSYIE